MCYKKPVRAPKAEAAKDPRKGNSGSFCVGMSEPDCGKAKTACHWTNKSEDGKRTVKAHCGRRAETSYEGMAELSKFNSKRYYDEELSPEEKIKQERWAKAAASVNSVSRPALPFGKASLCVGMKETDCVKSKPCHWTNKSEDGKRTVKAHCGRRIEGKGTVFKGVGTKVGGKSDPVLRLFYGY